MSIRERRGIQNLVYLCRITYKELVMCDGVNLITVIFGDISGLPLHTLLCELEKLLMERTGMVPTRQCGCKMLLSLH